MLFFCRPPSPSFTHDSTVQLSFGLPSMLWIASVFQKKLVFQKILVYMSISNKYNIQILTSISTFSSLEAFEELSH